MVIIFRIYTIELRAAKDQIIRGYILVANNRIRDVDKKKVYMRKTHRPLPS